MFPLLFVSDVGLEGLYQHLDNIKRLCAIFPCPGFLFKGATMVRARGKFLIFGLPDS